MPKYRITSPSGETFEVTAPDGASEADVMAYAQTQFAQKPDFSNVTTAKTSTESDQGKPKPKQGGIGRGLKLGLRNTLEGVAGIPDAFGGNALGKITEMVTGQPQASFTDLAGRLSDSMGLPTAETADERVMSDIGRGLSGTAVTLGAGGLASQAPGMLGRAGQFFSSGPGMQTLSTVTGSGAAGLTREGGGSEGQQMAAGLVGGLAPGAIPAAAAGTTRVLARGGEAGRQQMAQGIQQFQRAGTSPTLGQVSPSARAQYAEAGLRNAPGAASVVRRRLEGQSEELGQQVENLAGRLSPAQGAERGGKAIESGITGPSGFVTRTRDVSSRLYGEIDRQIPKGSRVDVSKTRAMLADLNVDIPGAPEISKFFRNARIGGIESGLAKDTGGTAAVLTQPGMKESAASIRQGLVKQAAAAEKRNADRAMLGMREKEPVMTPAEIDTSVEARLSQVVDNKLPYEALQKLRTLVGQEIDNASIASDVPRSKWKALYGALSSDLESAAEEAGPAATQAWKRANSYYAARVGRLDDLDRVVSASGGPEAVFRAMFSNSREGGTTLRKVMQSLDGPSQKDLAASTLRRLGRANPSAQDDLGEVFSPTTFLTNWNKMAPEAKRALFDRFGTGFRDDLDTIAATTSKMRDAAQILPNPSGTAPAAAQATAYGTILTSLAMMEPTVAAGVAGAMGTANLGARAFTSPKVVKWLAQQTKLPAGSLPAQLSILAQLGKTDPAAAELHQQLTQAQN